MRQLSQQTGKFSSSNGRRHFCQIPPKEEYFERLRAVTNETWNSRIFPTNNANCHYNHNDIQYYLRVHGEASRWALFCL